MAEGFLLSGSDCFLADEDFGGKVLMNQSQSALLLFSSSFFFFLAWRSTHAHQFHSLGQDQSTVAKRAETTAAEHSLVSCV